MWIGVLGRYESQRGSERREVPEFTCPDVTGNFRIVLVR